MKPGFLEEEVEASLSRLVWRLEKSMEAGLVMWLGLSPVVPGLRGSVKFRRRQVSSFKRRWWGPDVQGSMEAPLRDPWAKQKAYWRVYV